MKSLKAQILLIGLISRLKALETDLAQKAVQESKSINFELIKVAQEEEPSEEKGPESCITELDVAHGHKYMGYIYVGSSQ